MAKFDPDHIEWRRSTASTTSNCVEVAFVGQSVLVRHSRRPSDAVITFSRAEWKAFLAGVRSGEFDHDRS